MDDHAAPVTAHTVAPVSSRDEAGRNPVPALRNPILLRLEQLATEELGSASPLADAAARSPDLLLACIHWDLDSPSVG